jgi:adenosine deaminase
MEAACKYRGSVVVGFDVSGIEKGYPATLCKDELDEASANGFPLTIHCGETTPQSDIWDVLEHLHPTRISHALSAVNDQQLMRELARRRVLVEVCPTTNWLTRTVADLAQHPAKIMAANGIPLAISTDNPAICHTSLSRECALLMDLTLVTAEDIERFSEDARAFMFCTDAVREIVSSKMGHQAVANSEQRPLE